jgi:pimeloyl-ACP methyl ester carboxylesterase
MAETPSTFVLVHGAWWAGDWWWKGVAEPLRAAGHRVFTPALTGLGPRAHLLSPEVGLGTHILDVANLITFEELDDVVLVGHSYGGMVISGVTAEVPEGTIRSIVFLDAFLPEDGQSIADIYPGEITEIIGHDDPVPPPHWFGGDDAEMTALLKRKGTPHPRSTQTDKVYFGDARDRIPVKTFVLAKKAPGHMATAERLRSDSAWRVEDIDCGHMTMIEAPGETAEILLRAAG